MRIFSLMVFNLLLIGTLFAQTAQNISVNNSVRGYNTISFSPAPSVSPMWYKVYSSPNPIMSVDASGVRCLSDHFLDLYRDGQGIGGWTTTFMSVSEVSGDVNSGTHAIKATSSGNYQLFAFNWNKYMGSDNASEATSLIMYIKRLSGATSVKVRLNFVKNNYQTSNVTISGLTTSWKKYEIPITSFSQGWGMANLKTNLKTLKELAVMFDSASVISFDDVSLSKAVLTNSLSFTYGDPAYGVGLDSSEGQYFAVTHVSNNLGENKTIVAGQNSTVSSYANTPVKTILGLKGGLVVAENVPPYWAEASYSSADYIRMPIDTDNNGDFDVNPGLSVSVSNSFDGDGAMAISYHSSEWATTGIGDTISIVNGKDISLYDTLVFWVKGLYLDSENWTSPASDAVPAYNVMELSLQTRKPSLLSPYYISLNGLTSEWQKISIPFSAFGNPYLGMDSFQFLVFKFAAYTKGTFLIDKIMVEKNGASPSFEEAFQVLSVYPNDGAMNVSSKSKISVRFNHPIRSMGSGIKIREVAITNNVTRISNGFTFNPDATMVSVDFASMDLLLKSGVEYEVEVMADIMDATGSPLGTSFKYRFTVSDVLEIGEISFSANPFNPELTTDNYLSVFVSDPVAEIKAVLFSPSGSPVIVYDEENSTKGTSTEKKIKITGKNAGGDFLSPGLYIVQLDVNKGKKKEYKTLVIK